MSWQVKYGVSKAFGKPALKAEVEKAILHDSTDADIQFVIVIVAQKLTKFFLDKMRKEEKSCNIISSNHKDLAIQFNPGYVMKIVQRRNTKKSNQPPQRQNQVCQLSQTVRKLSGLSQTMFRLLYCLKMGYMNCLYNQSTNTC